ncbi:lipoate--protein ligase family protein [Tundrisphaera sp. TA3]|uniref:lipoate--protein ligase family protein n=1 Tax=Tundrisphaera sp. TA3 TaxID=3435775 RepID=UPI003EBD5428
MTWPAQTAIDFTLPGIPANLAADEALLIEAEESGHPAVLRFWEADETAVILGASCRIAAEVHVEACRDDGVTIARRSSGGGTVVIGPGALNVTVVVPIAADPEFLSVDLAQRAVLGRIASALRQAGPAVDVQGSGDLTLGGRKFSGSAQRRLRTMMMIHASILYDFPLDLVDRYLPMPPRRPSYRAERTHAEFLTNLPLPRAKIIEAISGELGASQPMGQEGDTLIPMGRARRLLGEKFSDHRWIGRL